MSGNMPVRERDIRGDNAFDRYTRTRSGCRGVVVREGSILLSYEDKTGWYMIPGGGLEEGETPEACCAREIQEETGLIVRPLRHFLTLNEYYEEWRYISLYYTCAVTGEGRMQLTEAEKRRGARPVWMPVQEALDMFSRHQEQAAVSEEKRGVFLREYIALSEWTRTH